MKERNPKQKIIIMCIGIILLGAIMYYAYAKEENHKLTEVISYEEQTNTQENQMKEDTTNQETATEEPSQITIYITGAVKQPGVYTLPEGSRIKDAIEQAQGLQENADIEGINLAYIMEDSMQITIPRKQENAVEPQTHITTEPSTNTKSTKETTTQKININTATEEQLQTLSGIGSTTAKKIIQYRKANGNFKTIEDIKNVNGIGDSKYSKIKDKICVK